jgi:hypothetical protein
MSQLQAFQQSANGTSKAVNGALLVDRLHDIPNRVREVATHGYTKGLQPLWPLHRSASGMSSAICSLSSLRRMI